MKPGAVVFSCLRGYYSRFDHADIRLIWGWDFHRKCGVKLHFRGKWHSMGFPCRGGDLFPPEMAKGIALRKSAAILFTLDYGGILRDFTGLGFTLS